MQICLCIYNVRSVNTEIMAAKPFESRIQDIVYNVEVGVGLRIIKSGLFVLFALGIMVLYTALEFKGFREAEAMEYGQLARNWAHSNQLNTNVIRPASMWYLIEKGQDENPRIGVVKDADGNTRSMHPDILHPPAYPMIIGTFFKMLKPSFVMGGREAKYKPEQTIIVPFGLACTLFSGVLIYFIGRRMFDKRVGLLSTTLFYLSDTVWATAISGMPTALVTFLALFSFYCAVVCVSNAQAGKGFKRIIVPLLLCSICVATAFLTRYAAIALLPGILVFLFNGMKGFKFPSILIVLFIFIAMSSPWVVRNMQVSGGPFGLAPYLALNNSIPFPENSLERSLAVDINTETIIGDVIEMSFSNMADFWQEFAGSADGVLMALFLTSFFFKYMRPTVHLFRWGILVSIIIIMFTYGAFGSSISPMLAVIWPVAIIYGCSFFFLLLNRLNLELKLANIAVVAAFIFFSGLQLIFTILPPRAQAPYPPYFPPHINYVCGLLSEEELVCTDVPWATAWYAHQQSLLLPYHIKEFYDINDYSKIVSGLYFSPLTMDQPFIRSLVNGGYKSWAPIIQGRYPKDFPLIYRIPLNNLEQLFLTDRPRWNDAR